MYIRSLVKKLNKMKDVDRVIYMPSEMVGSLESPEFIPFISEHPNSVLIIEDADVALTSRKQNGSIVKTILQLTDGILADCLRLKIIATFNCDLKQIDGALLRKGRLQYRHEFRHLSRPEALALAESCKIPLTEFDKPEFADKKDWTLAEIYNIREDFHWDNNSNVVKKIGFNTHKAEPKYGIQPPQD
jgi:SpoVK/Ycf46/Vps4 family AAA+-type ATPase